MEGSALRGRKNPMKPAVSWHTILLAKSSVLYLWRPWVAERGCSGQEQALCGMSLPAQWDAEQLRPSLVYRLQCGDCGTDSYDCREQQKVK